MIYVRTALFWVTRSRWLVIAVLAGVILTLLPTPPGLSTAGQHVLTITTVAMILIIAEPVPLPAIALFVIVSQVYFEIGTPNQIAQAFMNDAVFFIMGSLMLAVAIVKQGWDARIALGIIRITGNKTRNIALGFVTVSALLASFIGSHTVAALMLPIALSLIRFTSRDDPQGVRELSGLLLFSVAYGALVGSIGTPSGGGRNAIIINYWKNFDIPSVSYSQWMLYVYPLVVILALAVGWILWNHYRPEHLVLDSGVRKLVVQVAHAGRVTGRNIAGAAIFVLVFLGWVFLSSRYGLGTIALTGVALYIITGLVKWDDIRRNTHWGVIILFGAMISLGAHMQSTGAALWLSNHLVGVLHLGTRSVGLVSDTVVILLTTLAANMLSSTATVAVLAPVTLHMGPNVLYQGLITAIASAFGYFTAVAAPACAIIYSSGLVTSRDFLRVGWKIGLVSILILVVYANTYLRLWL